MSVTATTNQRLDIVPNRGGSVRVTCSSNVGQGNGGTSLPCKMFWISTPAASTAPHKINIGAAASVTLGVELLKGTFNGPFPIDDVSKIYMYSGGATDAFDITYVL